MTIDNIERNCSKMKGTLSDEFNDSKGLKRKKCARHQWQSSGDGREHCQASERSEEKSIEICRKDEFSCETWQCTLVHTVRWWRLFCQGSWTDALNGAESTHTHTPPKRRIQKYIICMSMPGIAATTATKTITTATKLLQWMNKRRATKSFC